jgi:hypothetical protein
MKTLFFGAWHRKGFKISHIANVKKITFFEKNSALVDKFPILGNFFAINLKIGAIKPANFVLFLVFYKGKP